MLCREKGQFSAFTYLAAFLLTTLVLHWLGAGYHANDFWRGTPEWALGILGAGCLYRLVVDIQGGRTYWRGKEES